jgi:hypothetical protein
VGNNKKVDKYLVNVLLHAIKKKELNTSRLKNKLLNKKTDIPVFKNFKGNKKLLNKKKFEESITIDSDQISLKLLIKKKKNQKM